MEIRPLREDEVETFVDELWIPFQREMTNLNRYSLREGVRGEGASHRRDRLSDDDSITYLAVRDGRLLGFVSAEVQTPPSIFHRVRTCHVSEIFVRANARRKSVGSALLERIDDWGESRDCEFIDLNVHRENSAAKALYEANGYSVHRYNMQKPLSSTK